MELMTASELADHFGVVRQTVDQWIRRRYYNGFPLPAKRGSYTRRSKYAPTVTALYDLVEVQRWRETYEPVMGRPRKIAEVCA